MADKPDIIHISPRVPAQALLTCAFAALIIAGLYVGREVLVPVALAILLSFVLSPFVTRLQSWRVPRVVSVLLVVVVGFSIIFALGGLMVTQASHLAGDLPSYQETLSTKIQNLRGVTAGSGTLERASKVLKDLDKQLQSPSISGQPVPRSLEPSTDHPIPVEVKQPDPGALTTLAAIIEPLIQPTTTTAIVIIFVIFILLQRQDLRNRFIRLVGAHDLQRTTAALDDAGQRLSSLFLTQIIFNALFGLVIGIGLQLIGVPSAPLWGLIAMILRFVPYVGALLSAVFPIVLAAAVGPGWAMVVWTVALYAVLELLAGQVLEPLVYGHSSGLSPVAIVLSASFWTWLWGPVGLVVATPLTICLVVLGRHVDRLQFLDIMLGDQPALTPDQMIYQRMLAADPIEASDQARDFLKDGKLVDYYDTILLEGLRLAASDSQKGRLDAEGMDRVLATVTELVDDLEAHEDAADVEPESDRTGPGDAAPKPVAQAVVPDRFHAPRSVLCIPGSDKLDEAIAIVLAQVLRRRGVGAAAETADALSISRVFGLDLDAVGLIALCYMNPTSNARMQYALRRLQRKNRNIPVVALSFQPENGKDSESTNASSRTVHGNLSVAASTVLSMLDEVPSEYCREAG